MTFTSFAFVVLFLACMASYWSIRGRWRNHLLTAFSYVFYAWWDWRLLGLLIGVTLVGYVVGTGIAGTRDPTRQKLLLAVSVVVNIGTIFVFRYLNWFIDEFGGVVTALGFDPDSPALDIILPIGVSFYTLQTLAYTIDVYRGDSPAEDDLPTFAAFVSFFPQLVAGPIERARNLLPQLGRRRRRLRHVDIEEGLGLIALGYFKKIVLADGVAPIVENFYAAPDRASVVAAAAGIVGFTVQIYADFSGYSDIARGTARLLGIDLTINFEQPYLSHNIRAFWRRWHISFSTWLRDYVYIPLGGSHHGRARTLATLMLTMVVGGVWHGANITFVVWGALHGAWLVVDRVLRPEGLPATTRWRQLTGLAVTHLGVTALWIIFRSPDMGTAGDAVQALLGQGGRIGDRGDLVLVMLAWLTMMTIDVFHHRGAFEPALLDRRPALTGVGIGAMLVAIIVFAGGAPVPFLYYQF